MSILNPLFEAVAWVMMRIHAVLAVPFGASSGVTWALCIIILVVLMRLVMVPLFIKQRNSMLKMQSHMPALQEIKKKYKNDKTKLNEETMKFYKENGINPLGGCLPLIAQLPVFWSLFSVLKAIAQWTPAAAGQVQTQPRYGMTVAFVQSAHSARIFGISLYDQFLHPALGESSTSRYLIVVFVLVSAATTFLTMRQSQRRNMMNPTAAPDPDQPGAAAAQAMSKNMMYIAPFFALTGLYWQFGLVLYWVTTNVWTLGQQHFLFRRLPVVGSTTVGASAVQSASVTSSAAVKPSASAKAVKSGTPAKPGAKAVTAPVSANAKASANGKAPADAKTASSSRAPVGSRNGRISGSTAAKAAPSTAAKATVQAPEAAPQVMTGSAKGDAAANGQTPSSGAASGMLRRFSRSKAEEPQDVPVAPAAKVVRQQPVRQTRSKRGNTGKR